MEETSGDSQDSETSSTSSWILLNTDENVDDATGENKEEFLIETTINQVDSKNQSDIESDGISIISESEFYEAKINEEIKPALENEIELAKTQDIYESTDESFQEGDEVENNGIVEEIDEISEDSFINDNENNEAILSLAQIHPREIAVSNCRCNLDQDYDFNRLLTWPSLFGTSIVILAVFISQFYSSDVKNNKGDGIMKQRDSYSLPAEKLDNPLVFCREKHKRGYLNAEFDFKKCVERYLSKNVQKGKNRDKDIYSEYQRPKYAMKDKNDNEKHDKTSKKRGNEYKTRKMLNSDEIGRPQEEDVINSDYFANDEFNQLLALFDEERKYLSEKEKFLRKWEERLIEREKRIQRHNQKDDNKYTDTDKNKSKKQKDSSKRQKGDFDYENTQMYKQRKGEKKAKSSTKHPESDDEKLNESNEYKKHVIESESRETKKKFYNEESGIRMKRKTFLPKKIHKKYKRNEDKIDDYDDSKLTSDGHNYFKTQSFPKKNQTKILDDENVTLTGEWYLNLVNGRQNIRKKEEKALWWFDRVIFRRNKRNKAYWYFQYMFNRENLRYRSRNI